MERDHMPSADDGAIDKGAFRRQLDATLRQRDPEALRAFLLDSGQWQEDTVPVDVPAAMWMMVLASPSLADLHVEAQAWLQSHGRAHEAELLAGRRKSPEKSDAASKRSGGGRPPQMGGGSRKNGKRF
jgi:hypothetical protein